MAYNQLNNPFKFGSKRKYQKEAKKSKFGIGKESRFEFTSRKRKETKEKEKKDYKNVVDSSDTVVFRDRAKQLLNSKYLTDEEKFKLRAKLSILKPNYKDEAKYVLEQTVQGDYPVYMDGSATYVETGGRGTLIGNKKIRDMFKDVPLVEGMESYETIKREKELGPQLDKQKNLITGNIPSYLQTTDNTPSFFYKRRNKRARTMRGFRMKRNRI